MLAKHIAPRFCLVRLVSQRLLYHVGGWGDARTCKGKDTAQRVLSARRRRVNCCGEGWARQRGSNIRVHLMRNGPTGAVELGLGSVRPAYDRIAAVRDAILAKFPETLKGREASELILKPSQSDDAKPLRANEKLTVLKPDETGELRVYVEVPEHQSTGSHLTVDRSSCFLADLSLVYTLRAQQFLAMCRTPSETKAVAMTDKLPFDLENGNLTDQILPNHILDLDIYENKTQDSPCLLRASIIPGGWPLFWADQQGGLETRRILYSRQSPTDRGRIDRTIKLLHDSVIKREPNSIGWFGAPGIAKSAALNEVLRYFIQHLGKPHFPPVVGLRVNGVVIIWEWDANTQTIRVTEHMGKSGEGESLQEVSETIHRKHGILIVEPYGDEGMFAFSCPTLIALSNRGADESLKFNAKLAGANLSWLIVGTWTIDECRAAAWIEYMTGRRDLGACWSDVASTVEQRRESVGGLLRLVLDTDSKYQQRMNEIAAVKPSHLEWHPMSTFNVHPCAELFVALEPDITSKIDTWEFLCEARKTDFLALAQEARSVARQTAENLSLEWRLAEKFLRQCLCSGQTYGWEWYPDPGGNFLNSTAKMRKPPPGFKHHLTSESRYFTTSVTIADSDTLYKFPQMVMGDCFSLSRKEKTVFLYQVSSRLPAHPFKISQVRAWRKALAMPQDWKLAIVYFLDQAKSAKSLKVTRGILEVSTRGVLRGWFSRTTQSQQPTSSAAFRISLVTWESWVIWSALQYKTGMSPVKAT